MVDEFRRRAEECRRLAAGARSASDKAFWMGLAERWRALESKTADRPQRPKPAKTRRQPALAGGDLD